VAADEDTLRLRITRPDQGPQIVPELFRAAASVAVMVRYGVHREERPTATGEGLDFGGGHRLRRFRFHAIVDAEGRDYLVWERPDHEPIAVIATHATAALRFLVTGLQKARSQESEG